MPIRGGLGRIGFTRDPSWSHFLVRAAEPAGLASPRRRGPLDAEGARQGVYLNAMAAAPPLNRRRICTVLVIAAATLATAAASGFLLSTRLRSYLRHQFIQVLREHYASDVELQRVNVSLYPDIQLVGTELMLRDKGRTDVPPLIHIGKITIHAGLLGILKKPYRLRTVRLEGLQINIPPAQHNSQPLQPHAPRTRGQA